LDRATEAPFRPPVSEGWSGQNLARKLKVRSCLIDGEAVACDDNGLAVFELLRRKPEGRHVLLFAWNSTARTCGGRHLKPARRRSPACCGDVCRACG
jgi:hypothetical protein